MTLCRPLPPRRRSGHRGLGGRLRSLPKYRRHKTRGQGVATIGGRDFYFGPYGTKASKAEYDRRCAEWLAANRPIYAAASVAGFTVNELILRGWKYASTYYRPESLKGTLKPSLRQSLLGRTHREQAVRRSAEALSSRTINRLVCSVRRGFTRAEGEQFVPSSISHALRGASLEPLAASRRAKTERLLWSLMAIMQVPWTVRPTCVRRRPGTRSCRLRPDQ